jgi:3-methyladenine DNA glycosylase AlkD
MENTIRSRIFELVEVNFGKFQMGLLPGIENILGVRLPNLRKLAKEITGDDWRRFISSAQDDYFEETMLQGMVIGYAKTDINEIFNYISIFVPKINNWSVCDSFCSGLKITKAYRSETWEFLKPYLQSEEEYVLRFGIVMLINFYIENEYIDEVLKILDAVNLEKYYVNIAAAWAVSICFVKFPEKTMAYLENSNLDNFTYNKALQKITESFRVDKDTKIKIRSLKRTSEKVHYQ